MSDQHKNTQQFFDEISTEWFARAYDPHNEFGKFPTSKVREDLTILELQNKLSSGRVVDLGCGTGHLVHSLLSTGYTAFGVDTANGMIAECRKKLPELFPNKNPEEVFIEADVSSMQSLGSFDAVTAMGLLEYLEDDVLFFKHISEMLVSGGFAFIECRNRLFNVYSANAYTEQEIKAGTLGDVLTSLQDVERFSPIASSSISKVHTAVLDEIKKIDVTGFSDGESATDNTYRIIHDTIIRRQHTPAQIEREVAKAGLTLEYVIYYHAHPYPPGYARFFPQLYHRLAYAMQPLGRTPLGASMCSSFVAVLHK